MWQVSVMDRSNTLKFNFKVSECLGQLFYEQCYSVALREGEKKILFNVTHYELSVKHTLRVKRIGLPLTKNSFYKFFREGV